MRCLLLVALLGFYTAQVALKKRFSSIDALFKDLGRLLR